MKSASRVAAWGFVGLSFCGLVFYSCAQEAGRTADTGATPAAVTASTGAVARGEYLANLGNCMDCHTPGTFYGSPDRSRMLSGSEIGWVGPWGVVFARNLTPDRETGLGTWSERDIVTALRTGVRPDGRGLAPAMPWFNFVGLTDEDAYAIAAYLKSLPPVKHRVPDVIPAGAPIPTGTALIEFPPPPAWDAPVATSEGHGAGGASPATKSAAAERR